MDIQLPSGKILTGVPEGTTRADIAAKVPSDWLLSPEELAQQRAPKIDVNQDMSITPAGQDTAVNNAYNAVANANGKNVVPEPAIPTKAAAKAIDQTEQVLGNTPALPVKSAQPVPEEQPFYATGWLGRGAKVLGEEAAKLTLTPDEIAKTDALLKSQLPPEQQTPGVIESLKAMGEQLATHPLDAVIGFGKGLAADPELLFPALWEAAPAKMAAAVAKAGAAVKIAETAARGAAIGATGEAATEALEGNIQPQQIGNTAAMFGAVGVAFKAAGIGAGKLQQFMRKPVIVQPALPTTSVSDILQDIRALDATTADKINAAQTVDEATQASQAILNEATSKLQEVQNDNATGNVRAEDIAQGVPRADNNGEGIPTAAVQGIGGHAQSGESSIGVAANAEPVQSDNGLAGKGNAVAQENATVQHATGLPENGEPGIQGTGLASELTGRRNHNEAVSEEHRNAERRALLDNRARIAAMSQEEQYDALLLNQKSGIKNNRAYEWSTKLPIQASIDVNSLKWINDNMGHAAGDELLQKVARALSAETPEAYHVSGDELVVQGHTATDVTNALHRAQDALKDATITGAVNGKQITVKGLGFSYGLGATLHEADSKMLLHKVEQTRLGLRAERGEQPPGVTIGEKNAIQEQKAAGVSERAPGEVGSQKTGGIQRSQQGNESTGEGNRNAGEQAKENLINVGLNTTEVGGENSPPLTEQQVRAELDKLGVQVTRSAIHQSDTEQTFSASLSRPLTPAEATKFSADLKQQAIAQIVHGKGELYGPAAHEWKPFNPEYFLTPEGTHPTAEALKAGEVPPMTGTHFSNVRREEILGSKFGTGMPGAERARLMNTSDSRLKNRIAFYVDEGKGVIPESGVGYVKHTVLLNNLYDGTTNPLKLPSPALDGGNKFESAVLDHGFDGYYVKGFFGKHGAAVLLGDAAKIVKPDVQRSVLPREESQFAAQRAHNTNPAKALASMPSGMRKAAQQMLERAAQGKRGGLVFGDQQSNIDRAAQMMAQKHGTDVDMERKAIADAVQNSITPAQAMKTNITTKIPDIPEFKQAVSNTPGASITEHGVLLNVTRFQKPEQEGATSIRTGVFYLPTGSANAKFYATGKTGYGGTEKYQDTTLLRAPLFVKGATGGKAPEAAYDSLLGKGAYRNMRNDVLNATVGFGKDTSQKIDNVREMLKRYGADQRNAAEIVHNSRMGNTLPYAVQENIVAHEVRKAGYDSVLGYSKKRTGEPFISEIFDVREITYPQRFGESDIHQAFIQKSSGMLSEIRARDEADAHRIASEYGGRVQNDSQGWKVITPSVVPLSKDVSTGDRTFTSGFYHPELGTAFVNTDRINSNDVPAVVLHEIMHMADNTPQSKALNENSLRLLGMESVENQTGAMQKSVSKNELGLYSQLAKAIDSAPDKLFTTGKNLKLWLNSNAPKLGVKKDEIYWSGINDWLEAQGKVSKQDVVAFLEQGGVRVEEVTLGGKLEGEALDNALRSADLLGFDTLGEARRAYREAPQNYDLAGADTGDAVKFESYQLPGGENYRELLLTLPATKSIQTKAQKLQTIADEMGRSDTTPERYKELHAERADVAANYTEQKRSEQFQSSHYDQPNILAHIRFNERTEANGNKVLFIEEIQSDWGQQGKRQGFGSTKGATQLDLANRKVPVPAAPFVSDTKSWTALALKRMIRYASENGFDRIAWTTGEQQAERYDLSKQIDSIDYVKYRKEDGYKEEGYHLIVTDKNGARVSTPKKIFSESELEDVVGKDVAKKIVAGEGHSGGDDAQSKVLSGLDLKVGGEGMKGYYDQIVPQVANDILKKLGGVKVESVSLPLTTEQRTLDVLGAEGELILRTDHDSQAWAVAREHEGAKVVPTPPAESLPAQQGFTITPELREQVLIEGLPLFSKSSNSGTGDIYSRVRARMEAAGETGNSSEATSYIVEEAMKMGKTAGHSRIDTGFWGWAQKALPEHVVNILKQWVANVRAAMYKNNIWLGAKDLSIDDYVALAKSNMKDLASGKMEAASGTESVGIEPAYSKINQTETPAFKRWFGDSKVVDAEGKPLVVYHGTQTEVDFESFKRSPGDIGIHFGDAGQANDRVSYTNKFGSDYTNPRLIPVYLSIKNPLRLRDAGSWNADNLKGTLLELFPNDAVRIGPEWSKKGLSSTKDIREFLQSKGYDGVVYRNTGEVAGGERYAQEQSRATKAMIESQRRRGKPVSTYDQEDQKTPEYQAHKAAYEAYTKFREDNAKDSYIAFERTQIKSAIGNRGTFDAANTNIHKSIGVQSEPKEQASTKLGMLTTSEKRASDLKDALVNEFQMAVMPMAAGSAKYRAIAKDYANADRASRMQWSRFDAVLKNEYTQEQRQAMWEAADEQNVLMQLGLSTKGKGLDRLPADQRETMNTLHAYGEELLQRAKDTGMFKGEGLPYWTPRMAVMIGDDGEYSIPPRTGQNETGASVGRNITTTSPSLKQRKYLTSSETEAAMKGKFGEQATLVRDIRAMPMAMQRLERAIAGRELINQIRELGKNIGEDLISDGAQPGYFTLDHPAFKTYRPRMTEVDGKHVPVTDQNGEMVFDRVPLYMRDDLKGPLTAIMSESSGKVYQALMEFKGKTMTVIMYSPLIHNAVEFGRALPMLPGKVATFRVYFEGNVAKHDNAIMREAIGYGLVPIGHRYGLQDISGIMEEPNLKPGRSLTAKAIGGAVGLLHEGAGDAVKRGIDTAGDVWHNTLLWDRVADLQMGIYVNLKQMETAKLLKQGLTQEQAAGTAGHIAAHMANRYAGALPNESMSNMSRKITNLAFFSRSFTIGNLGVMKDVFTGLPRDVQAQIQRDYGDLALRAGKNIARRKAIGAFIIDIGLMYAMNSVMQDTFDYLKRDQSLSDIEQGYVERMNKLLHKTQENPLEVLNSPLDSAASLTTTSTNEPGKENRELYDYDKNGTGIYVRLPTGKIGEEFIGWTTEPLDMLKRKESTFLRPITQTATNDLGFGRRVYNPDDPGVAGAVRNVGKVVKNFMVQQIPTEALKSALHLAGNNGDETDAYKVLGPLLGLTFSKGAPGGPAVGEMYTANSQRRAAIADLMPEVNQKIKDGEIDAAVLQMANAGMTQSEIKLVITHQLTPGARLNSNAIKQFYKKATPEQRERMDAQLSK